jgi:O-antigen/teichoic acid export membrane protein
MLPIISRFYSPEDFGIFNILLSYVGVITVFSGMAYHQAIVLPKDNKVGFSLFLISVITTILLFLITAFVVLITPYEVYIKFKMEDIFEYRHLVYLSVFFHGLYVSLLGWNLRFSNFGLISISRILRVVLNKSFIVVCALLFFGSPKFLIYGEFLGSVAVCLILMLYFNFKNITMPSFKHLVEVSLLYKQFPLFNLPNDLIYRSKTAIIIAVLVYFFSTEQAGYFGMAMLILAIPTTLIGASVGEVYYKKIAESNDSNLIKEFSKRIFKILCFCSFFAFTYITFFSYDLLPILLGEKWLEAGILISILSFSLLFEFIFGPFLNILKVLNKQQYLVYFQIVSIIVSVISIAIGGYYNRIELAFVLFSFSNGLNSLLLSLIIFNFIKIKFTYVLKTLFINSCFVTPFIVCFSLVKYNYNLNIYSILILSVFSIIIYIVLIYNFNNDFKVEYKNFKQYLISIVNND